MRWTEGKPTAPGWYFVALRDGRVDLVLFTEEESRAEDYPLPNLWWEYGTNWERHVGDIDCTHHQRVVFPPVPA